MRQQSVQSYEHESESKPHVNRGERHFAFSIRPFDPPSSPPPTSPLPRLPEIAPYSHASSPATLSPISPILATSRPVRPPRPQTSLPNLKPRTITSPEPFQRQRHSEIAAQGNVSPTLSSRRQPISRAEGQSLKLPGHLEPIKTLTLTLESASRFSDEVLGALPRLFDRLPSSHSSPKATKECVEKSEKIEPWRVYHGRLIPRPSKVINSKKATRTPVARSALFIPKTPPLRIPEIITTAPPAKSHFSKKRAPLHFVQSRKRTLNDCDTSVGETSSPAQRDHPTRACHKRSQAVTAFSFDFGKSYASGSSLQSSDSSEQLTSLPRIPSDPTPFVDTMCGNEEKAAEVTFSRAQFFHGAPNEAITFAVLPYAHTLHTAGPRPRTEKDPGVRFADADGDIEVGEDAESTQLTQEEMQSKRRKRILGAIATIALVIISTSGILIGIIWKLRSLR